MEVPHAGTAKKIILRVSSNHPEFEELVQMGLNQGLRAFYCDDPATRARLEQLDRVTLYGPELRGEDTEARTYREVVEEPTPDELKGALAGSPGRPIGARVVVSDKKAETRVKALARQGASFLLVRATDWKVIPVENLISEMYELDCELLAEVESPAEAELMFHTLERGVDGVVFTPETANDVLAIARVLTRAARVELTTGTVRALHEIPRSDRVCVDTTSLLRAGEGMLVGSTARGFVLVHAEVFETEFVASRPFRVNAGDVSAYILVPGDDPNDPTQYRTRYLSELKAGSQVVACDVEGRTRVVSVGRVKIETRPMLLLEIEAESADPAAPGTVLPVPINCILQNAETIRVVRADGSPASVSNLKEGDAIVVRIGPGATHFGTKIEETILEK